MAGDTFGERARAYHSGEITLDKFFKEVRPVLDACAAKMLRHWRAPASVDREDLVQELMVGCLRPFKKYDPARGDSVGRYVLWNAHDKAKKWLHKQRGAKLHGNADSSPSRFPSYLGDIGRDREGHDFEPERVVEALVCEHQAEGYMIRRETYRQVFKKTRDVEVRWGTLALDQADGNIEEAASILYEDFDVRCHLRLFNEADARKIVVTAVHYMASDAGLDA